MVAPYSKASLKARLIDGYTVHGQDMADVIDSYLDITQNSNDAYVTTVTAEASLVSYWQLTDTGTTSADSVGSNTLSVDTPTAITRAHRGPFPGSASAFINGGFFNNASPTLPSGNAARTVEFWAKTGTTADEIAVWYGAWASIAQSFGITFNASGTDVLRVFTWGNDLPDFTVRGLSDGLWHHYVVTYDGAKGFEVYIDSILRSSGSVSSDLNTPSTFFRIGNGGGSNPFNGGIAHVAIYNIKLSSGAIQTHYLAGITNGIGVDIESLYSADRRPTSPSAYDDEFDGSALSSKWTVLDDGAGNTYSTSNSQLIIKPATSAHFALYQNSLPAGDFKVTMKTWYRPLANFFVVGIGLRDSTNGKIVDWGITNNSAVGYQRNFWTTYTTFSSGGLSANNDNLYDARVYIQVQKTGSTLYYRYSIDGKVFVDVANESFTAFCTPNQLAIFIQGPATSPSFAVIDWIRLV